MKIIIPLIFLCLSHAQASSFDPNVLVDLDGTAPLQCLEDPQIDSEKADVCTQPFEFVCNGRDEKKYTKIQEDTRKTVQDSLAAEVRNDPILKNERWAQDPYKYQSAKILEKLTRGNPGAPGADTDYDSALGVFARTLKHTYQQVYTQLAAQGFTEAQVTAHITQIQQRMSEMKDTGVSFAKDYVTVDGGKPDYNQRLKSIKVQNVTKALSESTPESREILRGIFLVCGADGLEVNAYFSPEDSTFIICPGYLLEAVGSRSLNAYDFVVGHELAHSVDPLTVSQVRSKNSEDDFRLVYLESYKDYLACIDKNYGDDLKSTTSVIKYVSEQGIKDLEKHYEKLLLDPDTDVNKLFEVKRQIEKTPVKLAEWKEAEGYYKEYFGPNFTPAQSHSGELVSDYLSARSLGLLLQLTPDAEKKKEIIRHSLGVLCDMDSEVFHVKFGKTPDDGSHPNGPLRAALILKDPEIRRALSCKALSGQDKPWCSVQRK